MREMEMTSFGMADTGLVRKNNEDRWLVDHDLGVALLADGMGGASCGEVAATLTIEEAVNYIREPDASLSHEQLAKEAIHVANRRVRRASQDNEKCRGMGSTVVMVLWRLPRIVVANVGDSRAYLWRSAELRQISYDHTLQNQLRRSASFTEEQLRNMGHKNVLTMAIGTADEMLIQTADEELGPGDQVLLCSDGLWGGVSDAEIASVLRSQGSLEEHVKVLIEKARAAGGHDNTSVVLLACSARAIASSESIERSNHAPGAK